MSKAQHSKKNPRKTALTVTLIVLLAIAAGGGGYLLYANMQTRAAEPQTTTTPSTTVASTSASPAATQTQTQTQVPLADNPIDFASLQATNADVRAWISVPDTNVNYAVCQSTDDDAFYLDHDSDGNYSLPGAIYYEMKNSTNLSDPVTVFYGHDGYGDTMFSTLHYFEDADFFNGHEYFYVYTPGHIYTYEIISAFMYDDRHILNSFDFSNMDSRTDYFKLITNPDSLVKNVRSGVALDIENSKVITLSTCMEESAYAANRYLVSGVQVNDELTK